MASSIKITELPNIGSNIAHSTVLPVVNVVGNPITQKANLQIVGNLILAGAGGSNFVPAASALQSATVTDAAQPNITSVGTLTSLDVSGTSNLGNLVVANYFQGDFLGTIGNALYANVAGNVAVANVVGLGNIATLNLTGSNTDVLYGNGQWSPSSGGATDRLVNGLNELVLGTEGNVTLPSGSPLLFGNGNSRIQAGMGFHISSEEGIALEPIDVTDPLNPITRGTYFNASGTISYPGDITQNNKDNTDCPAGVETVIYTVTAQYQHAIKLFVMVEGSEVSAWETQACDIIAVRGYVNNVVHVTAYGVTYSSIAPLATFDGRWNDITNRMEITCLPSGLDAVVASVYAIEMNSND